MKKYRLKKGDSVIVICGNHKKQTGTIRIIQNDRVIVNGINMQTKNLSQKKHGRSEVIKAEGSLHISNVAYYDGKEYSKIGYRNTENKKIRFMRRNNKGVDNV